MFEIVPAVDLKAGRCVRLLQGRADAETVFSDDPVAMARRWQDSRARRLHVVDLDGAFAGRPSQTELVRAMIAAVRIPVQVGGGLREIGHVEAVLEAGARWAIVGTRAALDPAFLGQVCERFGDQVIVGIDASDGRVQPSTATRVLDLDAIALARDAAAAGPPASSTRTSRATAPRTAPTCGAPKRSPRRRASTSSRPEGSVRSTTSASSRRCRSWPGSSWGARSTAERWTSARRWPRWCGRRPCSASGSSRAWTSRTAAW